MLLFLTLPVEIRTWQWLKNNDLFDCVAGISYKGSAIGVGVFFDQGLLLTSANPLEPYLKNSLNDIRVHAITGAYNRSTAFKVICCANTPYVTDRHKFWMTQGKHGKHSPLHDLLVLNIKSDGYFLAPEAQYAFERHAFSAQFAQPKDELPNTDYYISGFGYIDKEHIRNMTKLEVEILDEERYLLDCHDYIPWEWGRFICLENFDELEGVQSGAPLLHKNLIYGIASFSVDHVKGDKQIFAFTDTRDYVYNLHYCTRAENDYDKYHRWWSKYWNKTVFTERPNFPLYVRFN